MSGFKPVVFILPLFIYSLPANSEDIRRQDGLQGATLSVLLMVAWTSVIKDFHCFASSVSIESYLENGRKLLAAGQLADALSQYHAAAELDPTNYMTFYRRATVYLAMGRSKSALPDLDVVLTLKPDFNAARVQRANVKLKQGKLDEARVDYEEVLRRDSRNADARDHLSQLQPIKESIVQARVLIDRHEYKHAAEMLAQPIERCPWDPELLELRAECYIGMGELPKAVHDLRPTTKLRNDNTAAHLKISKLWYRMGDAEESLTEIRECLKLDADHKSCHDHYKKVKKLAQLLKGVNDLIGESRWDDCITKVAQVRKVESAEPRFINIVNGHLCHCHAEAKHIDDAFSSCNTVLAAEPENADALCDRAETYINNEQYEEAVSDYKKAENVHPEGSNNRRIHEGLNKAEKLLKQSQKRDYYKILGVKRSAQKQEIMKAYRKLAAQWHPDQYNGNDKEMAEKMFIDIAAAKEVLTDPEKRSKFDAGDDPLDPEQQAGGGGPFWHQGFNPFGHGGFQFKFHFN